MKNYIYADNAATTKLDMDAFEAMQQFLIDDYSNPSQPYSFSKRAKVELQNARKEIAECINAEPDEIFFTSGGTESDNWALKEFGSPEDVRTIISSEIEHHAVLNTCSKMRRSGANVCFLRVDNEGLVSADELEKLLSQHRRDNDSEKILVSIMFANNEIGTIEPVEELALIAHKYSAFFHTDAVQAVGHIPIDVKAMHIDMLSASAHKFNGPKGIGFLYIKKGVPITAHNDGGAQERGLRAGTENVAAIVAMALALKKNNEKIQENKNRIIDCEKALISKLEEARIDFIRNGSPNRIPGNVSLSFKGKDGETLLHRLDLMKICVSTGSACDSINTQVSHVLKAIHLGEDYVKGTIRVSFGSNNTVEEAQQIANALIKIMA